MRAIVFAFAVTACTSRPDVIVARQLPAADQAAAAAVVAANNQFACDIYNQLPAGNSFYSPFSISTAFAMLDAGAAGQTDAQLRQALHYTLPGDQLHTAYGALITSLDTGRSYGNYTLATADRLFGQQGFPFESSYLDITKSDYEAELMTVDFMTDPTSALTTINQWVSSQTDGKIPTLFGPGSIDSDTRLVLTNAILFKGTWAHTFDASATQNAAFAVDGGSPVTVPMMNATSMPASIATIPGGTLGMLPFAGGDLSLILFVPSAPGGLAALEATLTGDAIAQWVASAAKVPNATVEMPKFTFKDGFDLGAMMQALGVTAAFEPGVANLSGIDGRMDLFVQDAVHQAWITVDEQGAEAAAATGIAVGGNAVEAPPSIIADHSFAYGIYDSVTGSVLFLGRMLDPSQAPPQ